MKKMKDEQVISAFEVMCEWSSYKFDIENLLLSITFKIWCVRLEYLNSTKKVIIQLDMHHHLHALNIFLYLYSI